ncbi:MAG: DUF1501 domain-containing protein [Archangiaceae bacterium]|nr:DUF1501 domain-containing protein [Archangiaceae bacterium]
MNPFSRRSLLGGAAALAAGAALPARAQQTKRKALAIVFFHGGFNALHVTPNTLMGNFTTTPDSMLPTGTGLFVDKVSLGDLPAAALQRLAVVGVEHSITAHDPAQSAIFTGTSSYPLTIAAAMQSNAALKCALLGSFSSNVRAAPVPGASLTKVSDVQPALDVMVGANRPGEPNRQAMAKSLRMSWSVSKPLIERNPRTLSGHATGFDSLIGALEQPVRPLDWSSVATAYGLDPMRTVVDSDAAQFAAAELVIQGGTPVAIVTPTPDQGCGEAGWDTHGDASGACARAMFKRRATAHLAKFLERTLAMNDTEVTTLVLGEFGRDPFLSDHATCLSAAVFGPRVKPGNTGPAFSRGGKLAMPAGTPGIAGLWSLVAELVGVTSRPFGANPHALVTS